MAHRQRFAVAPILFFIFHMLIALSALGGRALAQTTPANAPVAEHKHVLVLYSYGYGGRGVELFSTGLLSVLNGEGLGVNDLFPEYLDLERNKATDYRPGLRDFLTEKHRDRRFDLIIAVQQPALDFLLHDGRGIAAGVPVITVQAPMPSPTELDGRWFVSQLTQFDIPGTIQRALEAFPQTRRFLFVSGSSDADRQMAAAAAQAAAPWQGKLDFEFTTGLSANEILQRVAHLPAQSIIVFTQYNVDTTGQVALAYEMEERIIKLANAPVFGLYDFNLINGGIGGSVVGVRKLGETTGQLALDILNGTFQPRQPITAVNNAALPMFDWAQIIRWGGNPHALPKGTAFVNVPNTLFGQYRDSSVPSSSSWRNRSSSPPCCSTGAAGRWPRICCRPAKPDSAPWSKKRLTPSSSMTSTWRVWSMPIPGPRRSSAVPAKNC